MRKIVIEELIRAGAAVIFWMAGLYGLDYIGVIIGITLLVIMLVMLGFMRRKQCGVRLLFQY